MRLCVHTSGTQTKKWQIHSSSNCLYWRVYQFQKGRWDSSQHKTRIQGTFLFNSSYQLSGHLLNKVHAGACGAREFVLGKIPQQWPELFHTSCCFKVLYIDHAGQVSEVVLMHHRTALSAMCSLRSGYWVLGWGAQGDQLGQQICVTCKRKFCSQSHPKCPVCDCFLNSNGTLHTDLCGAVDYIFARPERGGTKSGGRWERITGTTATWTSAGHYNARLFCCSRFWGILVSLAKQEVLDFWTLLHINWRLNYNLVCVCDFVYTPVELRPKSGRGSWWSKATD